MSSLSQNLVVRFTCRALLLAAIASLVAAPLFAQVTSGTIFGTVKDASGALVKGATVTIANPSNGVTRTVTTSDSGDYVAPGLYPGTYTITVEAKGFKKAETSGIVLSAADKLNAGEIVLSVGAATESVEVTADAGQIQLQSNSGERSDLITGKQLNDVAMNGRNVLDYLKLIPGVSGLPDLHVSSTGGIGSYSVNGTRQNQHEYTIDGASNVDTGNNGGGHVTLNTDAIEEVKVLTSNYQAEFGKAAGGQIAVTTKSGTNQWHGNGRFFHRHEGLNANEFFNKTYEIGNKLPNAPPLYRYNTAGYQIGGPIKKDKLFAFWSQEFFEQFVPLGGTTTFYTPTKAERNGDFSASTDERGNPVTITGPGISGNKINRQDPNLPAALGAVYDQMKIILGLYPLPNVSGFGNPTTGQNYNYFQSLSGNAPRREDILRVDFQLTSKHRLYGRWVHNTEDDSYPFLNFPGPNGSGFACSSPINFPGGCTVHHPGWNASGNLVSTITPNILNEFSIGPSHTLSIADGASHNVTRGAHGIILPLLFPVGSDQSIPDMGFGGLGNVAFQGGYLGATPWKQANTTINVNDNLSWVRGHHTFKTGVFYQRNRKDQIAWGNVNGQFNFGTGTFSYNENSYSLGDPLASTLLGFFNSFDQSTARPTGFFRYNQLEFYVQDTWKITPRLTLDYGMRFAWIPPQNDAKNQVALFVPSAYDPSKAVQITSGGQIVPGSGDPLNGMRYVKSGQIPQGGWQDRGIMPEPRLGFAYDVFSDHKTILRGGVGMMHDRVQGNLIFNTVFNNPAVVQTLQVPADNVANLPSLTGTNTSVQGDKNIIAANRSGKVPTVYSYSFGIQHEIARGTTIDLAYVGTQSRHLVRSWDINAIPYGTAFTYAAQDPANYSAYCASPLPGDACDARGIPPVEPYLPAPYSAAGYKYSGAYAYGHPSYTNAPLVPYKGYGQIAYLDWGGTSNYNSLQASVQRRFSKGFSGGAVYTWSKVLTTADSDQDYQDPFRPRALDYRAPGFDRSHVIAFNYVYDIPGVSKHYGGPKWLGYLTDNYQLSGVTNFMTGAPIDLPNNWQGEPGAQTGGNMWGAIPNYYTLDQAGNVVYPTVGAVIRGTRDKLRQGGMQNWDMNLLKNIPLTERYSIQLRLEAYNVFNHPNFQNKNIGIGESGPFQWFYPGTPGGPSPSWCAPSGSFGPCNPTFTASKNGNFGTYSDTYNNTGGPGGFRVLQLGAKFIF